jgi:hypothetical protein
MYINLFVFTVTLTHLQKLEQDTLLSFLRYLVNIHVEGIRKTLNTSSTYVIKYFYFYIYYLL